MTAQPLSHSSHVSLKKMLVRVNLPEIPLPFLFFNLIPWHLFFTL